MMGQCKLCLEPVTRLQDSHFLSKGIYKRLRDKNEKNPNPWALSRKTAVQISRQKTAYLLCSDCEQRFSEYGENWVLGHCLQEDGSFSLAVGSGFENPRRGGEQPVDEGLLRIENP